MTRNVRPGAVAAGSEMQLDDLKILLAEDNPTNRLVALQMLESIGASVALARDGIEALDLLAREHFDVLLIDIEMPRVSGLEVIRRLAAGEPRPDGLTTIALTAYATRDQRAAIGEAGADGVITKPIISIEQFGTDILTTIEAARVRRGGAEPPAAIDMEIYGGLAAAVGAAALGELLGKVDADISDAYDRMTKAISGNDMIGLRAATHILIAVSGAIGAVGLQNLMERLNRAAHEDDEAAIPALGAAATAEANRVLAFVRNERRG